MRQIRIEHNHTQEYLIENTRLHISHYESRQKLPSLETLALFCRYYNISLCEFFAETTHPKEQPE